MARFQRAVATVKAGSGLIHPRPALEAFFRASFPGWLNLSSQDRVHHAAFTRHDAHSVPATSDCPDPNSYRCHGTRVDVPKLQAQAKTSYAEPSRPEFVAGLAARGHQSPAPVKVQAEASDPAFLARSSASSRANSAASSGL